MSGIKTKNTLAKNTSAKNAPTKNTSLQWQLFKATIMTLAAGVMSLGVILVISGTVQDLDNGAYATIVNMNTGKARQTSSMLSQRSRALWGTRDTVQEHLNNLLQNEGLAVSDLWSSQRHIDQLLNTVYGDLENYLARSDVSGVFLVLAGSYGALPEDRNNRAAIYLRTSNPGADVTRRDNIMMLWGSPRLDSMRSISLDQNWSAEFILTDYIVDSFYHMPLQAYRTMPGTNTANLGYWNIAPSFTAERAQTLFYSIPIVSGDGEEAGVLGFELTLRYFSRLMTASDMPFENSFYAMGMQRSGGIDKSTLVTGDINALDNLQACPDIIPFKPLDASNGLIWQMDCDETQMVFSLVPLEVSGPNSMFSDNELYMFAFAGKNEVLTASRSMWASLAVALLISMPAASMLSLLISRRISSKIRKTAKVVKGMNNLSGIPNLPMTNIREIDDMLEIIESMNANIADNASKMSTIVDLMGLSIGVFEITLSTNKVFITKSMYRILDIQPNEKSGDDPLTPQYIPLWRFEACMPQYRQAMAAGKTDTVFPLVRGDENRWMEMHLSRREREDGETIIYGAITDVTDRVREKERLVYESTYDMLTKLLNRNSYISKINDMIASEPDKYGVLAFVDLDKLKRVNDTFGHNAGDKYLQLAGRAFSVFTQIGGVAARIAGDEFVVYLHGGESPEELKERLSNQMELAKSKEVELPDGTIVKLAFSTGLAYYPKDSADPDQLVKYADFAMYEVKQSSKGGVNEFDRIRYDRSGAHTNGSSYVSSLLMGREVRYAFQPIVDLKTGRVTSFEAIMRPISLDTYSPTEILQQATEEGKLYELELFLFENFCKWTHYNLDRLSGYAVTFNTIYDQYLADDDFFESLRQIKNAADQGVAVVMEVSVNSYTDINLLNRKVTRARANGILVSVDDYSGTVKEKQMLESLMPDYVKISMDIVRGINIKNSHRAIVQEVLNLTSSYGSKIIAEGVETAAELQTLISLGVHCGQGFFFCPPEYKLLLKLPEHVLEEIIGNSNN